MKTIGIILSGCGIFDGSEIQEAVLACLAFSQHDVAVVWIAPDRNQDEVINHLTKKPAQESRNILAESARIARGDIQKLSEINVENFAAFVFPGGLGIAKNFSTYAQKGQNYSIRDDIKHLIDAAYAKKIPMGFICLAPILAAKALKATVTIGNDPNIAKQIQAWGGTHQECAPNACVIDAKNKVVSTPGYMTATNPKDVYDGCLHLAKELLKLT